MAKAEAKARPIYVKRIKKVAGGHHGGAWKVAYADFVTAMMAFFMVMWLVTAVSKDQRAAIFDYFKNPSMEPGKSVKPAPGQMGPGGASTSPINLGGGLDSPKSSQQKTDKIGATVMTSPSTPIELKSEDEKAADAITRPEQVHAVRHLLADGAPRQAAVRAEAAVVAINAAPLRHRAVHVRTGEPRIDRHAIHLLAKTVAQILAQRPIGPRRR